MIPHSSAGGHAWGHPLHGLNNGYGRVDVSQSLGQASFQPENMPMPMPQSQPRQPAVIDLTAGGTETQEGEPPAKRPRLEPSAASSTGDASPAPGSSAELRNTPGTAQKQFASSWRSRPAWSFQALVSEGSGGVKISEQDGKPASLPPLPVLPWKNAPPQTPTSNAARSRESSPSKAVQTTPYRMQVPSVAPAIKGNKPADFSPWTGNHPEDVLNEQTAKQGYYDRTQVSQNESNTARPSLYAQLKHRSGLQMLSSVFTAALEKRQTHNLIANPSTFKPPPRVTLTDNKREAWLRDLANPTVPLRKLSRTIPHGIRGKVLLDQCLNKWVPVSRAVWLAKCVGANEIRAFKRKGTSGTLAIGLEAKWVRDWTSTVQQFLEGVTSACGAADWKMKMTYSVSLTARLFFERLLDHEQYIGWFLASLEAASLNTVPVWLLMLGIYWDHVLRYRKRGRRLAEILLEKLYQISNSDRTAPLQPLVDRLSLFTKRLVLEHTSSVILPDTWAKYKDIVSSCLDLNDNVQKAIFQNLAERNMRIQSPSKSQETSQQSSQQRLIHIFDSIRFTHDISAASAACLNTVDDNAVMVSRLLEWTATPFRRGLYRVYTGVRLLRKWKMSGVDTDTLILDFLNGAQRSSSLTMANIYHIISELVRSQAFSVGRYLQWLMAKGVTDQPLLTQNKEMPGAFGLLTQLPVGRLPEHARNLRNTLISRMGLSPSGEDSTTASIKASIASQLPRIFGTENIGSMATEWSPSQLTWAVKSDIGQWIRHGVIGHCRDSNRKIPGAPWTESCVSALSPDEFYAVRAILEGFGDLSMLADVLKQASNCDDYLVLASVADTVNYHFNSFCVIGATSDLFRALVESYARLKRLGTPSLDLVFSLIELGLQIPTEFKTVAILRQDLTRIENKSTLTAPSPLSDQLPLAFSDSDPTFQEKLDHLLWSNSGMDEITMDSVFHALTKVLGSSDGAVKLSTNQVCRYLSHLRPFHPKHFDAMLVRWICSVLRSSTRPALSHILPPLIGVGCVTIHAFIILLKKLLESEKLAQSIPNTHDLRTNLLELLIPPDLEQSRSCDLVSYRFLLARKEFLVKYPKEALDVVRDVVVLIDKNDESLQSSPRYTALANSAMKLIHVILTQNPESAAQYCEQEFFHQQPTSTAVLSRALDHLLGFDSSKDHSVNREAERVIGMNDNFSLPFCQLKLQMLFNTQSGAEVKNGIIDVMFNAAVEDSRARRSNWVGLVKLMSPDAVCQVRERAEKEFLSIPIFEEALGGRASSMEANEMGSLQTAKIHLTIIEKLAHSIPETGVPSIGPILADKMDFLLQKLVTMQNNIHSAAANRQGAGSEQSIRCRPDFERALAFWFSALLRMVVLHRATFSTSSSGPRGNATQEQCRLLISIFCISLARLPDNVLRLFPAADYFPHPVQSEGYRPCPGILLQTHALDVAASLIDTFPDTARQQCARFLKDKCPPFIQFQTNCRFLYLLGPIADAAATNAPQSTSLPSPAAGGTTPTPLSSGNVSAGLSTQQQPMAPASGVANGLAEGANYVASHLRLQHRGRTIGPYPMRPWELLEDAAPIMGTNDTAVSLKFFDARRIRA